MQKWFVPSRPVSSRVPPTGSEEGSTSNFEISSCGGGGSGGSNDMHPFPFPSFPFPSHSPFRRTMASYARVLGQDSTAVGRRTADGGLSAAAAAGRGRGVDWTTRRLTKLTCLDPLRGGRGRSLPPKLPCPFLPLSLSEWVSG